MAENISQPAKPKRQKTVTFHEPAQDGPTAAPQKGPEVIPEDRELEDNESDFEHVTDLGLRKFDYHRSWTSVSRPVDLEDAPEGKLQRQLSLTLKVNKSASTKKDFIPVGKVEELITKNSVVEELERIKWAFRNLPKRCAKWFTKGKEGGRTISEQADIICKGHSEEPDDIPYQARASSSNPEVPNQVDVSRCLRRIFAILLLIDRPTTIKKFIDEGLCDEDLPFKKRRDPESGALTLYRKGGEVVNCVRRWRPQTLKSFIEWQWRVLAPFFYCEKEGKALHYPLQQDVILPFTKYEAKKKGGHGEIYQATIHPDHHNFDTVEGLGATDCYAVKMIKGKDERESREQFEQEVRMLKRVKHEHVVYLFATFQHCDSYYLLLPWADCDLAMYWRTYPKRGGTPNHDIATLQWMAQQCAGIAGGLYRVHIHLTSYKSTLRKPSGTDTTTTEPGGMSRRASERTLPVTPASYKFFGIHGDIKPSNILWFPSKNGMGTLKIADFGAGDFSPFECGFIRPSASVSLTLSYRPPEHDIPIDPEVPTNKIKFSAAYDIWALGCVYLEFVTWCIGGQKMLDEFQNRREFKSGAANSAFFELVDKEPYADIKPTVREHFTKLRETTKLVHNGSRLNFLLEFLEFIENRMLVIRLPGKPGRSSCRTVLDTVGRMADELQDCEGEE